MHNAQNLVETELINSVSTAFYYGYVFGHDMTWVNISTTEAPRVQRRDEENWRQYPKYQQNKNQ